METTYQIYYRSFCRAPNTSYFKENVKNKNVLKEDQLVKKHTIIEDNVLGGAR